MSWWLPNNDDEDDSVSVVLSVTPPFVATPAHLTEVRSPDLENLSVNPDDISAFQSYAVSCLTMLSIGGVGLSSSMVFPAPLSTVSRSRLTPGEVELLAQASKIVTEALEREQAAKRADQQTQAEAAKHRRAMKLEGDV